MKYIKFYGFILLIWMLTCIPFINFVGFVPNTPRVINFIYSAICMFLSIKLAERKFKIKLGELSTTENQHN
jgi:hypothetical protein